MQLYDAVPHAAMMLRSVPHAACCYCLYPMQLYDAVPHAAL